MFRDRPRTCSNAAVAGWAASLYNLLQNNLGTKTNKRNASNLAEIWARLSAD